MKSPSEHDQPMMPDLPLHGKTAVVAGAGRGIGAAIATTLASAGATVAVVEMIPERAAETVGAIDDAGGIAFPVVADLTDPVSVRTIVPTVLEHTAGIDVLTNVAGGSWAYVPYRRLHEVPDTDWATVQSINLTYVYRLTADVLKHMLDTHRRGSIVHVTSIAGVLSSPHAAAYGAAKAAVVSLTSSLAQEYGPDGIRVNAVAPGRIATPATSAPASRQVDFTRSIPLRAMGEPQDVADAVLFMASDRAKYITGQTLLVDGGASSTPGLVPTTATRFQATD